MIGGVEATGGCPWRVGGVLDERPERFLIMARGLRGVKGETNSIEDAVPAVFRDPGWSGGEGGSGHVLVDVVGESSAE